MGDDAKARVALEHALKVAPAFPDAADAKRVLATLVYQDGPEFMTVTQKNWLAAGLIATGFALLYWNVLAELVKAWYTDDNYSHGFLIVPVAAYLAWERRDAVLGDGEQAERVRPGRSSRSLCLLLTAGILGSELFTTRVVDHRHARRDPALPVWLETVEGARMFPLAFLLLMIPIPAIIFNQLAFPLQIFASRVGESAIEAANIPVLREGNVLILANTTLEVAEACSGIRSLVSLITLAIVFGYFSDPRGWVRVLITASAVPIAVLDQRRPRRRHRHRGVSLRAVSRRRLHP